MVPRWGLADRIELGTAPVVAPPQTGPSASTVRTALFVSVLVLSIAAFVFAVRYALLIFNRNTLLNSWVAGASVWLGMLASLAAIATVGASVVMLVRWLIARRAAAFGYRGISEPRSARALWAGCLLPLVNVLWAPVYVIELALIEERYVRLRRPIVLWWIVWALSYAISLFAIATSWTSDVQGIANNTVMMVLGYLCAATTVAAIARVFEQFEQRPVERSTHRWLVMGADPAETTPAATSAVELDGQEPAA